MPLLLNRPASESCAKKWISYSQCQTVFIWLTGGWIPALRMNKGISTLLFCCQLIFTIIITAHTPEWQEILKIQENKNVRFSGLFSSKSVRHYSTREGIILLQCKIGYTESWNFMTSGQPDMLWYHDNVKSIKKRHATNVFLDPRQAKEDSAKIL